MTKKSDYLDRGIDEERLNYTTHGIGLILMLFYAVNSQSSPGRVLSAFLALTFLTSVLYHSAIEALTKDLYRRLDMASIYLAIGATTSTYCYTNGSDLWHLPVLVGFSLFVFALMFYGEVWNKVMVPLSVIFASLGIALFSIADLDGELTKLGTHFYVGCVMYFSGLWFYVRDERAYFHTIWHIFVVLGALAHSSYYYF